MEKKSFGKKRGSRYSSHVESKKYVSGNIEVDQEYLPLDYGGSKLILIARDPYCIYACWYITAEDIEKVKKKIGEDRFKESRFVIRMYDVTLINFDGKNANYTFDIDIDINANNWYIHLWRDNVSYCADLGVVTPKGDFYPIVRSNFVVTPHALGVSYKDKDVDWMLVDKEGRTQLVERDIHRSSSQAKEKEMSDFSSSVEEKIRKRFPLTEDDIRNYYAHRFLLLRRVLRERKRAVKKIRGLDEILRGDLDKREFVQSLMIGSSQDLFHLKEEDKKEHNVLNNIGSFWEKKDGKEKKKELFFDIRTELIVYGRIEPDGRVFLNGKEIKLRKDGTFTLRFALDEGEILLKFHAVSKDNLRKRNIHTAVERKKTRYSS